MAQFIANIQLQAVNGSDYDLLYKKLDQSSKTKKRLDKNEAFMDSTDTFILGEHPTLQEVNEEVFKVSSKTGNKHSFFVIRYKMIETG